MSLALSFLALALAAACGGGSSEPTATVVPRPTLLAPPPQIREDSGGPAALALGPRYDEATLALLPDAEPFGVRDVVEGIDASEAFTVHRFISAGSQLPVVVGLCSPRAPNGVVLQTQHTSGAVTTLFVWAYEDPGAILEDWLSLEGDALRPLPPRPIQDYLVPGPPTPRPTPDENGATPEPPDPLTLCTTTRDAAARSLAAIQHDNLVVLLTENSPHPGAVYTSPGANAELLEVLRTLGSAP
jgi:hypothetical protein